MAKRKKDKESKVMVGIKCQCKDRAVKRPEPLIRKTVCKKCGKVYKTNREVDICFDCEKSK
ncbi:MAG: hypothetical protein QMD61_05455 [Methanobacterium sp.]|nr:hypothetical protein [Methanobacterium sp.]